MVEIKLRSPEQLLNSLDPAPFRTRDLDDKAASYILGAAEESRSREPLRLVIDLPAAEASTEIALELPAAVQNSFAYRAECTRRDLRDLFRVGRISLTVGLLVLAACIVSVQIIESSSGGTTLARTLEQGLFIVGWVAIWRPIEIFLYDWWPVRHRIKLLDRLAKTKVEIRAS